MSCVPPCLTAPYNRGHILLAANPKALHSSLVALVVDRIAVRSIISACSIAQVLRCLARDLTVVPGMAMLEDWSI